MAEAFAEMPQDGTADLTHAEWLGLLVDRDKTCRETKRFESRMRKRPVVTLPGCNSTASARLAC